MNNADRESQTIAGLFMHIMMLRKELKWIGDTTHDPNTKMQVRVTLERSLKVPPENEERDHESKGSNRHLD